MSPSSPTPNAPPPRRPSWPRRRAHRRAAHHGGRGRARRGRPGCRLVRSLTPRGAGPARTPAAFGELVDRGRFHAPARLPAPRGRRRSPQAHRGPPGGGPPRHPAPARRPQARAAPRRRVRRPRRRPPRPAGHPTIGGDRPRIVVHLDHDRLRQRAEGAGVLETGGPLAAGDLRGLCRDSDILPAVLGTDSDVLDLGHTARLATPAVRAALDLRDGGCIFPHCDLPPSRCQAHHILHPPAGIASVRVRLATGRHSGCCSATHGRPPPTSRLHPTWTTHRHAIAPATRPERRAIGPRIAGARSPPASSPWNHVPARQRGMRRCRCERSRTPPQACGTMGVREEAAAGHRPAGHRPRPARDTRRARSEQLAGR